VVVSIVEPNCLPIRKGRPPPWLPCSWSSIRPLGSGIPRTHRFL